MVTPPEVIDNVIDTLNVIDAATSEARFNIANSREALAHLDRAEMALTRGIAELRRHVTDSSYAETLARLTEVRENPAHTYVEGDVIV